MRIVANIADRVDETGREIDGIEQREVQQRNIGRQEWQPVRKGLARHHQHLPDGTQRIENVTRFQRRQTVDGLLRLVVRTDHVQLQRVQRLGRIGDRQADPVHQVLVQPRQPRHVDHDIAQTAKERHQFLIGAGGKGGRILEHKIIGVGHGFGRRRVRHRVALAIGQDAALHVILAQQVREPAFLAQRRAQIGQCHLAGEVRPDEGGIQLQIDCKEVLRCIDTADIDREQAQIGRALHVRRRSAQVCLKAHIAEEHRVAQAFDLRCTTQDARCQPGQIDTDRGREGGGEGRLQFCRQRQITKRAQPQIAGGDRGNVVCALDLGRGRCLGQREDEFARRRHLKLGPGQNRAFRQLGIDDLENRIQGDPARHVVHLDAELDLHVGAIGSKDERVGFGGHLHRHAHRGQRGVELTRDACIIGLAVFHPAIGRLLDVDLAQDAVFDHRETHGVDPVHLVSERPAEDQPLGLCGGKFKHRLDRGDIFQTLRDLQQVVAAKTQRGQRDIVIRHIARCHAADDRQRLWRRSAAVELERAIGGQRYGDPVGGRQRRVQRVAIDLLDRQIGRGGRRSADIHCHRRRLDRAVQRIVARGHKQVQRLVALQGGHIGAAQHICRLRRDRRRDLRLDRRCGIGLDGERLAGRLADGDARAIHIGNRVERRQASPIQRRLDARRKLRGCIPAARGLGQRQCLRHPVEGDVHRQLQRGVCVCRCGEERASELDIDACRRAEHENLLGPRTQRIGPIDLLRVGYIGDLRRRVRDRDRANAGVDVDRAVSKPKVENAETVILRAVRSLGDPDERQVRFRGQRVVAGVPRNELQRPADDFGRQAVL